MSGRRTIDDLVADARARISRITPEDAAAAVERGALLVDLRCEDDRSRFGVIPGAVPIARSVLEWRADPASEWRDHRIANLDARLILMCGEGYSSSLAAASLCDLGFTDVADVIGGFFAWRRAGLPVLQFDER